MDSKRPVQVLLETITSLATLAAAIAILWTVTRNGPSSAGSVPMSPAQQPGPSSLVTRVDGVRIPLEPGSNVSPGKVAIVEFSDFECPFCGRHARDTYPRLKGLIQQNQVQYEFRHFPLERIHPAAFVAAEAAECAKQQGKFWEMHNKLFADQKGLNRGAYVEHAAGLGLDTGRFERCLDGETAPTVKRHVDEAGRLGVKSTPTFFVGVVQSDNTVRVLRRIGGAQTFEVFASTIEEVAKEGKSDQVATAR